MHWPAEPFRDADENGRYDPGEDFVNLNYSGISTTDAKAKPIVRRADAGLGTDLYGSIDGINPVWNAKGPNIAGYDAIVWGILYVSGNFDCQGTPLYYGSVVTKAGTNGMVGPVLDDLALPPSAVEQQIRNGGGGMPPFGNQLSDDEIEALVQYLTGSNG